jgi:RHS repeat-associated protein
MTVSTTCADQLPDSPPRSTGKERDAESGNDYFGARYYASSMGRFLSPDWSAKVEPVPYAKLDNPQSLNLYSYLRNNPLSGTDPDGHSPEWWQRFWNGLAGYGRVTNAERDARIAQQRQWLIDHSPDDATKDHYRNAAGKVVFEAYGCMQSASCLQDAINAGQVAVQVVGAVAAYKVPVPGLSGKEGAKDAPSWAKQYKPRVGESGKEFATRLLNEKYGQGNWKSGPGTEFNQIQKWADRSFMDPK